MYDKFYLSNNQLQIIESWLLSNNTPLLIYGNMGSGKTSLAKEILKDLIVTIIDTLSLKNSSNLYEEIYNVLKKNNITLMFKSGGIKRGLIIDDLDVFHKYDKKCCKSIINFITEYNYYDSKVIIICNTKFMKNRSISKIKGFKLYLNYD